MFLFHRCEDFECVCSCNQTQRGVVSVCFTDFTADLINVTPECVCVCVAVIGVLTDTCPAVTHRCQYCYSDRNHLCLRLKMRKPRGFPAQRL